MADDDQGIELDNASVEGDAEGAVVGSVSVGGDGAEGGTVTVSDDRFEVVDGQLKLKEGVSLDEDEGEEVPVTVTVTDSDGNEIAESFGIEVQGKSEGDDEGGLNAGQEQDDTATEGASGDNTTGSRQDNNDGAGGGQEADDAGGVGVELDNTVVEGQSEGAIVGSVTIDSQESSGENVEVSDERFEVVDGQLKLKDGVSLDQDDSDKVSVDVTVTSEEGDVLTETFHIEVRNNLEDEEEEEEEDEDGEVEFEDDEEELEEDEGEEEEDLPGEEEEEEVEFEGEEEEEDGDSSDDDEEDEEDLEEADEDDPNLIKQREGEEEEGEEAQLTEETTVEVRSDSAMGSIHSGEEGAGVSDQQAVSEGFAFEESEIEEAEGEEGQEAQQAQEEAEQEGRSPLERREDERGDTGEAGVGDVGDLASGGAIGAAGVGEGVGGVGGAGFAEADVLGSGDDEEEDAAVAETEAQERAEEEAEEEEAEEEAAEEAAEEAEQAEEEQVEEEEQSEEAAEDRQDQQQQQEEDQQQGQQTQDPTPPPVSGGPAAANPVSIDVEVAEGVEDQPTAINISLGPVSGGDTVTITISNVPEGAVLSAGTQQEDGTWVLESGDLDGLSVQLPENVSGEFELSVEVVNVNLSGSVATTNTTVTLDVAAVADEATLSSEASDNGDGTFSLEIEAGLVDIDGSESLSVGVRGLPEGTVITDGTNTVTVGADGEVLLDGFDTSALTVTPPEDNVELSFDVFAQTQDGQDVAENTVELVVDIADVPEAPTDLNVVMQNIPENAEPGTVVGQATATDSNVADTLIYSLDDDAGGLFVVDPDTGAISIAEGAEFNFEDIANYEITVRATDDAGLSTTTTVSIDITDVNETPTDIAIDNLSISENDEGGVVGNISVVDPDAGDSFIYSVSDDRFEVVDGQLKLKDGESLNHEDEGNIGIEVTVTDAGGLTHTETFNIEVTDVNEAPTDLTVVMQNIPENTEADTVVGQASVNDPDSGDEITYSLDDDAGGLFVIDGETGEISIARGVEFDFEDIANYEITVRATDEDGLYTTTTVSIDITDVNEAPTDINIDNLTVPENEDGAVIGDITVVDQDGSDTHTYTVSDDRFEVVDGQLKLKDGVSLDHEDEGNVEVEVTVTDAGGLTYSEEFTIEVTDVNEAPTDLTVVMQNIPENTEADTVVGQASVNDPDAGDEITYSLDDDAGGLFVIDGETGEISIARGVEFDFEDIANYEITVRATDEDGLYTTTTVSIDITDVNEAPSDINIDNLTVPENEDGAVIGDITVVDQDGSDTHTYTVSDDRFEVVGGQLKLKDGVSLDHEDEGNVEVEVTVTDSGGLTYSEEFTIEVTDVNEAPTDISLDETSIDENEAGAIVGNVSVVDPDAGDTVTYTVSDERFEVVDGQLKLKDGVSLNHEAEENVSVDITATDADGLSYTESFTIDVDDVNEAPTNLVVTIDEFGDDIEPGTVVGHATADDPDVGDTLTFSLDNDSDGRFVIDALTGEISVAEGAEFDDDVDYDITVRVTDEDGLYVTQAETIDIADDNDDPRSGDIHAKPFDEDTSIIITEEELLAKVHDKDSDTFSITAIADPEHGTLVDNGDGTWTYTPDPDYHGAEKIEFTISDNEGGYTSANLHLTVTPEKDEPAAVDDVVLGTEDTPVVISADSLLANDSDADGDSLSITGFTQPETGGTVADNGDGTFTFTPDADFVGDASFEYTVSDGQGGTSTATATVSVAPVEDAPTDISIDNLSIGENDDGAVIGTLSVTDPDAGDTHTYSVSDDRFEVVEGQLKLKAGESLNHEAEGNVDVEVTATDAAGNTYSETLSIEVTDVNEAPTDILLDAGGVAEGVDGAVVGNISVVDPDVDDTHIYTISDERFEVVDGQLKLKDGVSLDYEAEASVTVDITATDEDGFGYTESFTIDVGDVNEAPTDISLDNLSVAEDDEGAVIGTLSVTDPDAGDAHTYSVSDDRFEVVDGQLKLKDGESLDDDDDGDAVSIEVTATDADGLSRAETFNISITEAADDGDDDHGDDDDDDHDDDHDDDDEDNQAGQQGDDDDDHDDDDDEDEDDDHGDDHDDDDEDEADAQYDGVLPVAADDATTLTDDSDTLAASSSDDVIDAGAGDDVINAGRGDDIVLGGEGDDIIEGDKGDDTLLGGAGDDIIDGGKGEDVLYGNAGNDTLDGGGKADILIGGAGDDTIDGGSGDDIIMGGTGDDVMSGGTGNDLFLFGEDAGNDIVSGGAGTDEMDISAMAADQGWTVVLEDGSEIAGQGDDYLELTNDSSGSIQFEDGTEINFDSMDKITFG